MATYPTIKKGSTGPAVSEAQGLLNDHGFGPLTVDGIFGDGTDKATRAFQKAHGLTVDGTIGSKTWDALLANLEEEEVPAYDDLDELSRRMLVEIAAYIGWDYAVKGSPSSVALPSRLAPPDVVWKPGRKTDTICCIYVAGVVGRVFDEAAKWTSKAWARFMVPDSEPWGMVNECVAAGIGRAYTGTPQPGKWYVVQGWSGLVNGQVVDGSSGHQWIQWGPDLLCEANTYTDEDADGKSTDEGAVAWKHRAWNPKHDEVRLVELFTP